MKLFNSMINEKGTKSDYKNVIEMAMQQRYQRDCLGVQIANCFPSEFRSSKVITIITSYMIGTPGYDSTSRRHALLEQQQQALSLSPSPSSST